MFHPSPVGQRSACERFGPLVFRFVFYHTFPLFVKPFFIRRPSCNPKKPGKCRNVPETTWFSIARFLLIVYNSNVYSPKRNPNRQINERGKWLILEEKWGIMIFERKMTAVLVIASGSNRVLPTCCRKRCQNFFTNLLPVPKENYWLAVGAKRFLPTCCH